MYHNTIINFLITLLRYPDYSLNIFLGPISIGMHIREEAGSRRGEKEPHSAVSNHHGGNGQY
jgi:hypothetical protein